MGEETIRRHHVDGIALLDLVGGRSVDRDVLDVDHEERHPRRGALRLTAREVNA